MGLDKRHWPGCLLEQNWLPALVGNSFGSPWATSTEQVASNKFEWVLRAYSENLPLKWNVDDGYDAERAARFRIPGRMVVWLKMMSPQVVLLVLVCFPITPLTFGHIRVVGTWVTLVSVVVLFCPWSLANRSKC